MYLFFRPINDNLKDKLNFRIPLNWPGMSVILVITRELTWALVAITGGHFRTGNAGRPLHAPSRNHYTTPD